MVKKIEIEIENENDAEVLEEIEKRNVLLPNKLRLYPKNLGG